MTARAKNIVTIYARPRPNSQIIIFCMCIYSNGQEQLMMGVDGASIYFLKMRNHCQITVTTTSILYIIYLSLVSGQEESVYFHGNSDSYKTYFSAPYANGEQWILRIETTRFGRDFIAFFATDNDRQVPIQYHSL